MTTPLTLDYEHTASASALFALQVDRGYLVERTRAEGDRNIVVEIDQRPDGYLVSVARNRTIELPPMVRGLIQPTNYTIERMRWRATEGGFAAEYVVEARGLPGALAGTLELVRNGSGARFGAALRVDAHVPLIGARLERLMVDGFRDYLLRNAGHDAHRLRSGNTQCAQV